MTYTPSPKILENYAKILVTFALNSGKGIKKNDVVYLRADIPALPLAKAVYKQIILAGGHPITSLNDEEFMPLYLKNASQPQLKFFPKKYYKGLADTVDHWVSISADEDPFFLKGIDPKKIITSSKSKKPFRDWLDKKEDKGQFTWTLCIYATEGMAKEAGLSVKQYWEQIEKACFLRAKDPIKKWREIFSESKKIINKLNKLPIDTLHLEAKNTDLTIKLGDRRKWIGGSGRNIPSFEIFTSPDWRGTNGTVYFDLPLYRYGNIIKDIKLEFKNGKITKATAKKNQKLLREMISQKNADKIGEFSLTDKRFSKINKFMANTLFDENFGGPYGNTHLAVGKSYHDTCSGNTSNMTEKDYKDLGFNDSPEHTDIIASTPRTVTATLKNGKEKVIYKNGKFLV